MKIAVYGTLRYGWNNYNNYKLHEQTHIGNGKVNEFSLYVSGLPFAVKEEGSVVVEVYDVDATTFQAITLMELGAGYNIETVDVHLENGEIIPAHFYSFPYRMGKRIESGDFNDR